ncbi:MAG: hypothetical protein AAF716_14595 [Cyanobacteria bacterium P01_D01_bin.1]
MPKSPLYSNDLTLSARAKTIPYAADCPASQAEPRDINYGFKNLKIKPSLIETIPELADDASLKAVVAAINKRESCFFTIGCSNELIQTDQGYHRQGYLEFAWNCASCIQDAINYFSLYFHFNKSLLVKGFNQPVYLKWLIQEAAFSDVEVHGFSCSIYIRTKSLSSPEQASQAWQLSLRMIDTYLSTVETLQARPIYTPLSECSSGL